MACLGVLWGLLWPPVQTALQSFLEAVVGDCLTSLRDRAVAAFRNPDGEIRNPNVFPGNQFESINTSAEDLGEVRDPNVFPGNQFEPINTSAEDLGEVRNPNVFPGNQFEPINTSAEDLFGRKEIDGYLKRIGDCLKDDAVRIIGICGMGGVGKTTLLRMVNNEFHKTGAPGFDVVICVTVSQEVNILKIQKQIGDRLGLRLSADATGSSSQAEDQAKAIFNALLKRRFLLLLDDVWKELDREPVGIPPPTAENKCKIILTTRSRQVCTKMKAHPVDVNFLNESESWKLFKHSCGTEVDLDDPRINPLARAVAGKCGGLPLALITVGHAMAQDNSVGAWEEALEQIRERPDRLTDMEEYVLSLLKFSFDRLGDETTKQCLLYCCLFQEDHPIPVEKVIEYWVGEGLLDDTRSDSIGSARNRGQIVITKLTSACLLESGVSEYYVKMHDVVRQMCLWLTGGELDKSNTFLVCAGLNGVPRSERWGDAKRISLMHNSSQAWPHNIPSCPNLRTLLCHDFNRLPSIPRGFFECMPALCVLDLSNCEWLESLPEEISFLAELRYLNLKCAFIKSLPRGLGQLAKLSQLNLDYTRQLSHIPREAIPTLTGLRVLGLLGSSYYYFSLLNDMGEDTRSCWDRLEELRLSVRTLSSLEVLLKFDRLCLSTTCIRIYLGGDTGITPAHLSGALERLKKVRLLSVDGFKEESEVHLDIGSTLETLDLMGVRKITVMFSSHRSFLRLLRIWHCRGIRDLMWIRQLSRLEEIEVQGCDGMEELLPEVNGGGLEERGVDDEAVDCDRTASLPLLRSISLWNLPALKSISARPVLFPALEYLDVRLCPQLKKLPLGPDSAQNIREIRGERDWWESLEWHQDADGKSVKSRFLQYYVEIKIN